MRRTLVLLVLVAALGTAHADTTALLRGLDTDNKSELDTAISAIQHAPAEPGLADVLFAAGRACEDRLLDPPRALALYERILREMPDASVAIAAQRRVEKLRAVRGHEGLSLELAQVIAHADQWDPLDIWFRAEALSSAHWPGAPDAALWLGDWLCRTRNFAAAQHRYALIRERWPASEQARLAHRNAAGCALDAHDFSLATKLANELPGDDEIDAAVKTDLLAAARRGRTRAGLYLVSWFALALAILLLLGSLVEAIVRGGRRRPSWRPPIEVLFLAPVAVIIVAVAFFTQRAIAPAVARISGVGLVFSWISGLTLDLLRARDRSVRVRAILHIAICLIAVVAIGYIAITRDGLVDMLADTMRYGPGD
ncbi:MAG TPA: hypothetical protein VLB44_26310 [Kofleriaceae bacterium]|nr:hypothetical protein [Kofleriaceae bacterium]